MRRNTGGNTADVRKSALWGSGNRGGEHRSNALWGKGGRGGVTLVVALVLSLGAGSVSSHSATAIASPLPATFVEPGLLERARQNPERMFKLIVQSNVSARAAEESFESVEDDDDSDLKQDIQDAQRAEQKANIASVKSRTRSERDRARMRRSEWRALLQQLQHLRHTLRGDLDDRYEFINGISLEMSGRRLAFLARIPGLTITEDVRVLLSGDNDASIWPAASGLLPLLGTSSRPAPKAPAIAIVDSGIEADRLDFGGRVVHQEVITTLKPNSPQDGRGHGTFVASIAAGSAPGKLGASPTSPIVDVDVMDDSGMARTSDVIAGAEWVFQNRERLNIRVANFSLHSARPSNFTKDPLDRAVEKLWFGGVVVVAAAGNYGKASGPSGVPYAPGNDPFVITVGALDLNGEIRAREHDVPSWSAYGRTFDGFLKPDISAAGRYMVGAIPAGSTLAAQKASSIVKPGYIRLSGTSFSAPVVAGAAAQILARNPSWTPDQVKGALMQTARRLPAGEVPPHSAGVGEVNAWMAAAVRNPINPNKALNRFLAPDQASGVPAFDAVSWSDAAKSSVSWDAVSWSDVSWTDVSWSDVSWSDVSWTDVSWSDVLAVADVSWEDAADSETSTPEGGDYVIDPALAEAILNDPELYPQEDPVTATDLLVPVAPVVAAAAPLAGPLVPADSIVVAAPSASAPIVPVLPTP